MYQGLLFLTQLFKLSQEVISMTTQELARDLLVRRRQQHENRRAALLRHSGQEVARYQRSPGDWQ